MGDSSDMFEEGEKPEADTGETLPSVAELEAAGQSAMFGAEDPPQEASSEASVPVAMPATPVAASTPPPPTAKAQPYRVLARKYRPQTFAQLIGQDAMVKTLANAIRRDRLAHAFLMTGVRGVGKTTTARLIAKALNCIGPDGLGGPTIDPCGQCEPCIAIADGRHIDVIEMDAASHTGVDDVREIIEAVRYSAVSARYKIYIIDEVHMLSRNAFNALLKTLEEPPPHVKFLFATTEADKLPVTVLSRCQRFDLRRIDAPLLAEHFAGICRAEDVTAEEEALAMIAAAAEGSVRDGLSILDQAIAHADLANADVNAEGRVTAAQVQDMLGLADKSALRRLFACLLAGDGPAVLEAVAGQFSLGVEPVALLRSAMELVHRITVAQLGRSAGDAVSADERAMIEGWASTLNAGQLHRLWQLLLKGHDEVRNAPDPLVAAQMALLRVMHAADMPDPGSLLKKLGDLALQPARQGAASGAVDAGGGAPSALQADANWKRLVAQVEDKAPMAGGTMRNWVRPIELAPGLLRYALAGGYSGDPSAELAKGLQSVTGERWSVELRTGEAALGESAPCLRERAEAEQQVQHAALLKSPLVEAAFAAFPGAELIVDELAASGQLHRKWSNRA